MARQTEEDRNILANFQKEFKRHQPYHNELKDHWTKLDKAYAAVVSNVHSPTKAGRKLDWESRLFPPYVGNTIDILVANIIDDRIEGEVVPKKPNYRQGAEAHTCLLNDQLEKDRFQESYVLFVLQCLVRGISGAHIPWEQNWEEAYYEEKDDDGKVETVSEWICTKDQSTFIPVDMRYLMWDAGAETSKDIRVMWHTVFETMETLEEMSKPGPNNEDPIYKNIDLIKKARGNNQAESLAGSPDLDVRDRIKLVSRYTKDRLIVVANNNTIIRDEPNPYIHSRIPFVIATAMPRLFRVDGRSVTDMIKDIQWMLWDFSNQKLDNARLMNNAVTLMRDSIHDDQRFRVYPGAKWPVMSPQDVKFWEPNPTILEQSVMIEGQFKDDINNLSGAVAILAGATGQAIDNETATGANIANNGAQRRLLRMKQNILFAVEDAFLLMIKNNQQLVNVPTQVRIQQEYGGIEFIKVDPTTLVGEFEYKIRSASESFNKQQKRAEALSFAQFLISNGPIARAESMGSVEVDYWEILAHVIKTFDLSPNKFVKRVDPMLAQLKQMMQQTQQEIVAPNGNGSGGVPTPAG